MIKRHQQDHKTPSETKDSDFIYCIRGWTEDKELCPNCLNKFYLVSKKRPELKFRIKLERSKRVVCILKRNKHFKVMLLLKGK